MQPTRQATELPIAFLFDPALLDEVSSYFPYDTGAAADGIYGEWSIKLREFDRYILNSNGGNEVPRKIVHHVYQTNSKYVYGQVANQCGESSEALNEIHQFLGCDLTSEGVDHRQCTIECQIDHSIELGKHLRWIGFPAELWEEFEELFHNHLDPYVPDIYDYKYSVNVRPSMVAHELHTKATDFIEHHYLKFEQRQG
jgi:hypothetical protein